VAETVKASGKDKEGIINSSSSEKYLSRDGQGYQSLYCPRRRPLETKIEALWRRGGITLNDFSKSYHSSLSSSTLLNSMFFLGQPIKMKLRRL